MTARILALCCLWACLAEPARPACSPARELTELKNDLSTPFYSPMLSRDRLTLYFGSTNGCGLRAGLWRAHRTTVTGKFSGAICLVPSDINNDVFDPSLSSDGKTLWYVRGDGNSGGVLVENQLTGTDGNGEIVSTATPYSPPFDHMLHPTFTDDRLHVFFVLTDVNGAQALYTASRDKPGGQFDPEQALDALNLTGKESGTTILADGSKLYFDTHQFGGDNADHIGFATRATMFTDPQPLTSPQHVDGWDDDIGSVNPDDQTIVFSSGRDGSNALSTIWIACE